MANDHYQFSGQKVPRTGWSLFLQQSSSLLRKNALLSYRSRRATCMFSRLRVALVSSLHPLESPCPLAKLSAWFSQSWVSKDGLFFLKNLRD